MLRFLGLCPRLLHLFAPRQFIFGLILAGFIGSTLAQQIITYPRPESATDKRTHYPLQVLQLALSKSGKNYLLQESKIKMLQNRAVLQVANGDIQVLWSMTSRQREQELLPIRFALDKGLLGWRVFLIRKNMQAKFAQINSLQDLQTMHAVQGHDWPDSEILRANHLPLQHDPNYDFLFKMLAKGQVDYFPRALSEVWDEAELHAKDDLAVEQHLLLRYPAALYFFVSKKNTELAKDIQSGLQVAQKDGSFDRLFTQFYGPAIAKAKLQQRLVLKLHNPLVSPEMAATLPDLTHSH